MVTYLGRAGSRFGSLDRQQTGSLQAHVSAMALVDVRQVPRKPQKRGAPWGAPVGRKGPDGLLDRRKRYRRFGAARRLVLVGPERLDQVEQHVIAPAAEGGVRQDAVKAPGGGGHASRFLCPWFLELLAGLHLALPLDHLGPALRFDSELDDAVHVALARLCVDLAQRVLVEFVLGGCLETLEALTHIAAAAERFGDRPSATSALRHADEQVHALLVRDRLDSNVGEREMALLLFAHLAVAAGEPAKIDLDVAFELSVRLHVSLDLGARRALDGASQFGRVDVTYDVEVARSGVDRIKRPDSHFAGRQR